MLIIINNDESIKHPFTLHLFQSTIANFAYTWPSNPIFQLSCQPLLTFLLSECCSNTSATILSLLIFWHCFRLAPCRGTALTHHSQWFSLSRGFPYCFLLHSPGISALGMWSLTVVVLCLDDKNWLLGLGPVDQTLCSKWRKRFNSLARFPQT